MKKILFVDDEGFFAKRYREALAERFELTYLDSVESALDVLRGPHGFDAVVLDIMLPPPKGNPPAAGGGLDTGIWLLQELARPQDHWTLPVLILTNRNSAVVAASLSRLNIPPKFIEVRSKIETPAFYLPGAVESLIGTAHNQT